MKIKLAGHLKEVEHKAIKSVIASIKTEAKKRINKVKESDVDDNDEIIIKEAKKIVRIIMTHVIEAEAESRKIQNFVRKGKKKE